MEVMKDRYTITELSSELNVTDHTLRYYEKEFKIYVPKDERGRRFYTPELANLLFQIKNMRDEGLEIKAIKRILADQNIIPDPSDEKALAVIQGTAISPVPDMTEVKDLLEDMKSQLAQIVASEVSNEASHVKEQLSGMKNFLDELKIYLSTNISIEISAARDYAAEHVSKELAKTKLELGACVENNSRRLESKMDKHFQDIDNSLSTWRERNSKGVIKRIFSAVFR